MELLEQGYPFYLKVSRHAALEYEKLDPKAGLICLNYSIPDPMVLHLSKSSVNGTVNWYQGAFSALLAGKIFGPKSPGRGSSATDFLCFGKTRDYLLLAED